MLNNEKMGILASPSTRIKNADNGGKNTFGIHPKKIGLVQ